MKTIFLISYVIVLTLLCPSVSGQQGQQEEYLLLQAEELPPGYRETIERAAKIASKGEKLLKRSEKARVDLEQAMESEDVHPIRQMQLRERVYRLQLAASTYFEDAHKLQYRALRRYLENEYALEYNQLEQEVRKQFRQGRVLRRRAVNIVPGASPENLVKEASGYEQEALKKMAGVFSGDTRYALDNTESDENDEITPKVVAGVPDVIEETEVLLKPKEPEAVKKVDDSMEDSEPSADVFFSIQFLATRRPISNERVRSVYDGPMPVTEDHSDGWFRFFAGRFASVEEALERKESEGIYGFIVAYKNRERITLNEARELLSDK
ncbi:MAG: hypothetical protein R6U46_01300 [Marinilabilia sp.]